MNNGNFLPVGSIKSSRSLLKSMKIVPFFWHDVCKID
jgi:hypothetical protein